MSKGTVIPIAQLGAIGNSDVPVLTGEVTSSGQVATLGTTAVTGKALTNFARAPGVVTASDTILSAFNKTCGRVYVFTLASDAPTGANTTPINLTDLVWTYEANAIYFFKIIGRINPGVNTTGCGFQLDVSSGITDITMEFYHQLASSGSLTGGHSIADDASVGVSSGTPGTTTGYPVIVEGMLRTTSNTGTAQVRFRSETTAAITAKAGMTLVVDRVA